MVLKTVKLGHHHILKLAVLSLLSLLRYGGDALAQNEYPTAKNSYIKIDGGGINLIRPNAAGGWARGLGFFNQDMSQRFIAVGAFGNNDAMERFYIASGASPWNSGMGLYILPNGNIGIGTYSPTSRLEVAGPTKWTGNASSYTEIHSNTHGQYLRQFSNNGTKVSWVIRGYSSYAGEPQAEFNNGGVNVNGTIRAKEIKLEATNWPDYVFEEGYDLMPLEEVKVHIDQKGHLPGLKPAKEYGEQGVGMMELNQKLLEKIEELTLYLIELRNEVDSLKKIKL
jgi:hypothetical protein